VQRLARRLAADRDAQGESCASPGNSPISQRPTGKSIAVLPFQNISGDVEQGYFADRMVEEIITGLSRIKWLFVIA